MSNQFMIINNQYSIMTMVTGISLVIITVMSYLVIWHPRVSKKHWVTQESKWRHVFGSVPWILITIYVGTFLMAIIVTLYYSVIIPNW